jgi:hypothetical protein
MISLKRSILPNFFLVKNAFGKHKILILSALMVVFALESWHGGMLPLCNAQVKNLIPTSFCMAST